MFNIAIFAKTYKYIAYIGKKSKVDCYFLQFLGLSWNSWLPKCWKVFFDQSSTEASYVPNCSKTSCNTIVKVRCLNI